MSVESALRLIEREFKYHLQVAESWNKLRPDPVARAHCDRAVETAKLLKRIERSLKRKDKKRKAKP